MRQAAAGAVGRAPLPLAVAVLVPAAGIVIGVAALRLPALTILAVIALGVAAVALRDLAAGVALFTVLSFFESIPGTGQSATAAKLASALLLVAWIGQMFLYPRRPLLFRDGPAVAWLSVAFVLWAGASTLWAAASGQALSGASRLAQMLFLTFLVFSAVRGTRELRWIVWAYVAGAALTAIIGLASGAAFAGGATRFRGDFGNPNNLAAVVLPAIAFAGFGCSVARRSLERALLAIGGLVLIATLFLTESRGGFIGLGVMILAAVVFGGPLRPRVIAFVLCLGVLGFVYLGALAPPSARHRLTQYSAESSTGRVDLWGVALDITGNHPLLGIGADNFTTVAPRYLTGNREITRPDFFLQRPQPVHNTYLEMLTDLGGIGLLLFVAFLVAVALTGVDAVRRLSRTGDLESEILVRGMVVGAAGMLTAFVFFSAQYQKQLWLILGAVAAASSLARRSAAADQGVWAPELPVSRPVRTP